MSKDIVNKKTRQVFRELMVGWYLREIEDEFKAAGIECDTNYTPEVQGQRRSLVGQYYRTIDWTSWKDVRKVTNLYENTLLQIQQNMNRTTSEEERRRMRAKFNELITWLGKDGFDFDGTRLVPRAGGAARQLIEVGMSAAKMDAAHLSDQVRRMTEAIERDDPALAIGTAKELIETVCKTILEERGKPIRGLLDIPVLTKETLKELKLVPEDIDETKRGAEVIRRVLRSLGTIGNDLNELRALYGTGHGKGAKARGLSSRHAKLAVGVATAYATFLLETHQECPQSDK